MPPALEDLPHYTYDDYIQWEGRWELIDGIPYAMAPTPSFEHQDLSHKISGELYVKLKGCEHCRGQLPVDWQITDDTIVQPDNMVICGTIVSDKKLLQTPSIIFEILSPSTSHKDRTIKYRLYEAAGVAYYVIVSPFTRSADIYHLEEGAYTIAAEVCERNAFTFVLPECTFRIDFMPIFGAG